MAQLSDDCFAFGGPLLSIEEAARLMASQVQPLQQAETVPLKNALGRVLAENIRAKVAVPPFDNSAVDGYAVRHADLSAAGDTTLRARGEAYAGGKAVKSPGKGETVRIFTGAPMPKGTDTVFMQEDVKRSGASVIVPPGLKRGANRRLKGEDVKAGARALPKGRRLHPQDVALAAAVGMSKLKVTRMPRVAVFSTGNELTEPGRKLGSSGLYDSNRVLLLTLLRKLGIEASDLGILPDDPNILRRKIAAAAKKHDLVLTSGGVSTGEADHVKAAVESVGRLVLWRLAIKPGRPVAMGVVKGAAFIGLPGNPVAVFVTFVHVVRPFLLRLMGAVPEPFLPLQVRVAFSYKKKKDRREYVRVTLKRGADGKLEAVKHPQDGAGVITSLTESDGLLELPEDVTRIEPGETVGFLSYESLTD